MATKLLKLPGPLGMFAAVNEVICQLHLAQERGYEFVVDWRQSAYADPTREGDPWEYFFEPCFPHADWRASETLPYAGDMTDARVNIMRPRLYSSFATGPMLLPVDRTLAHNLIRQYIRPKPEIARLIESTRRELFPGNVIGLHLRGPGRLHGGTQRLKRRHELKMACLLRFTSATSIQRCARFQKRRSLFAPTPRW